MATVSWLLMIWLSAVLNAQQGPVIRDSNVGYIDTAIPGDIVRLRYDAAYDNVQPSRAEFFWPRSGSSGPGPTLAERSVDYQDAALYCERMLTPCVSGFLEAPFRWLNPENNENAAGIGDLNAGFKYVMLDMGDVVGTFQWRTYVPTGNASRGLGTDHVSLEPALLLYHRLPGRWCMESELRYGIPIGGSDFAGDVIRYGTGIHYDLAVNESWQLSPVLEVVGWTVLDGQTSFLGQSGQPVIAAAGGDTIVNAKAGVRSRFWSTNDIYLGYGQPLTGDQWYANTFRIEWRQAY